VLKSLVLTQIYRHNCEDVADMTTLLEELQSDWEIVDLDFNFRDHVLTWHLAPEPNSAWSWKEQKRIIRCEGVIAIRYGARVNDSPPWLFDKAVLDELSNNEAATEIKAVGRKQIDNPDSLNEFGPYFRLSVFGECVATVICRKVVADKPAARK